MGVRLILDLKANMAAIYDSVTDIAFGQVYYDTEEAEAFLEYTAEQDIEIRSLDREELLQLQAKFHDLYENLSTELPSDSQLAEDEAMNYP